MTHLSVRNLAKSYSSGNESVQVLDGTSFELNSGDQLSIVGPSGSGKSTLLYILGTLTEPSQGQVLYDDVDPFTLPTTKLASFRNKNIGFVFQDHHLLPQLTVQENVLLPALANGKAKKEHIERAGELIGAVGLSDRGSHFPSQISGGERQRAAVARALLFDPQVVLADEPTGNLDRSNSDMVCDLLFDLPDRNDTILVVVTHSDDVAQRASQRMAVNDGRLVPCT